MSLVKDLFGVVVMNVIFMCTQLSWVFFGIFLPNTVTIGIWWVNGIV